MNSTAAAENNLNLKQIVDVFETYNIIPRIVDARFEKQTASRYNVQSKWSVRNVRNKRTFYYNINHSFDVKSCEIPKHPDSTLPSSATGCALSCYCDINDKLAVIIDERSHDNNKENEQFLQIWNDKGLENVVNLSALNKHGQVHCNYTFQSINWSPNGAKVAYIAEKTKMESQSFFAAKSDKEKSIGLEHEYVEDWGEQLGSCKLQTLCVYDVIQNNVDTFDEILPVDYSFIESIWAGENSVILVAHRNTPFKLGLSGMNNHPNTLFYFDLVTKDLKALVDENKCVASPRVSCKHNFVLFLSTDIFGPHHTCANLMLKDLSADKIDEPGRIIVGDFNYSEGNSFPGLYLLKLPQKCFLNNDKNIILTSVWQSNQLVLKVDLDSGNITKLTDSGCWNVYEVKNNVILATFSTFILPDQIRMGVVNGDTVSWTNITAINSFETEYTIHTIDPEWKHPEYENLRYECILIKSNHFAKQSDKSLVVIPHGGPHYTITPEFDVNLIALCKLCYAVLIVNYRGSLGFGKDFVDSLPGNIGVQDISDVQQAAVKFKNDLSCDKVYILGASHGGYLALSLISKYPDFYKACIARNPVTNFAVMEGITDIPHWVYWEINKSKFNYKILPSLELLKLANEKSPTSFVSTVKTPCLMLLSGDDKRVPPSQGLMWAKKYKAYGGECKILWYKGNSHQLDSVVADSDAFVNTVLWFVNHV